MQLINVKDADGILSKRQWWTVGESCEALVVYENGKCSINITGNSGDLTASIGKKINEDHSCNFVITATIDSGFIEIPEDELEKVLSWIDICC
ncbi:MAG: hypothetical protein ABW095_13770 [Candidatus Thiodiazotropha sp.]